MVRYTQVRHLSIPIERPSHEVYAWASDPRNLPAWAAGLGQGIRPDGKHWRVATPQGELTLRFAPPNNYGILDHTVVLPDGSEVYVPLRVIANGAGSEVVFTLYRQPEMDDAAFERDTALVNQDLATLKARLEK